jgi:transitional endoplasmic reticulum ATPase
MSITTLCDMDAKTESIALRIMFRLEGYKSLIRQDWLMVNGWDEYLGVCRDLNSGRYDAALIKDRLKDLHDTKGAAGKGISFSKILTQNLNMVGAEVGLSNLDKKILGLVILVEADKLLNELAGHIPALDMSDIAGGLHQLLEEPEKDIREALGAKSLLRKSGLVRMTSASRATLDEAFKTLSARFVRAMVSAKASRGELLKDRIVVSEKAELRLVDFDHIGAQVETLKHYLINSIDTRRAGVNVLFYGPPGTGKTQLARTLGRAIRCKLYEVAWEDEHGRAAQPSARMQSYLTGQSFLAGQRALLLFDEIEDIFSNSPLSSSDDEGVDQKAWINKTLEDNAVPTFWVSNCISTLDPAFIRRFDMVVRIGAPPYEQRKKIIQASCGSLLNKEMIEQLALSPTLTPAVVTRASKVVSSIHDKLPAHGRGAALVGTINNTLMAQGFRPVTPLKPKASNGEFDPQYTNSEQDLAALSRRLKDLGEARICLYGPPGTGKSAYARWLAEQVEAPLLERKASDLLSKWHGQTERNIAEAFEQASKRGALLMIDEVDSFLRDRREANTDWQVTQVNEMLTQMESYQGIFIASTNLMEAFDQAALRRFDMKLEFGFMSTEQAVGLLGHYCQKMKFPAPKNPEAILRGIDNLTPGDFATVARRHRFSPVSSAEQLVGCLREECDLKEGSKAPIGFVR